MKRVAWDTETERFRQGRMAPPMACLSWAHRDGSDVPCGVMNYWQSEEWLMELLRSTDKVSVGHHIAYDTCVAAAQFPRLLPVIFDAYLENRITDTLLRQRLLDVAEGCLGGEETDEWKEDKKTKKRKRVYRKYGYSMEMIAQRLGLGTMDKKTFRTHYGALRDTPVDRWEAGARQYAIDDATMTLSLAELQDSMADKVSEGYLSQVPHIEEPQPLADEYAQARAGFWLQLMSVWGIRTNPERVDKVEEFVVDKIWELRKNLAMAGLVRKDGSRDTKKAKERMLAAMGGKLENCKRTDTGDISLAEAACKESGDLLLNDYAEVTSLGTVVTKDLKALRGGKTLPIHSRFEVILETGRTSSSSPNIQNIRKLPGIRECFVPRPGMVYLDADYDGLELRTLGQVCTHLHKTGKISRPSVLARVLREGKDPHLAMAAQILGISYEEAEARKKRKDPQIKETRNLAKAPNFGFPGGLGAEKFVVFAQGYGQDLTVERARELKDAWLKTFPEMVEYFAYINSLSIDWPDIELVDGREKEATKELYFLEHLYSKRLRGGATFCASANSFFQGLGADATKHAGFLVSRECYVDRSSPLFGCRIVNYIHDQFLVECPEERCHEAAMRLAKVMVDGANEFLPDVPATVDEPMVVRCWSKGAEQVFDPETLKLIPWEGDFEIQQRSAH